MKVSHVKIDIAFTAEMMYPYEERHTHRMFRFLYGHGKMVTASVEFRTQKFLGTVLGTKSHFRHEKTPKVTSKYTKVFLQNYEIVTRFHKKNGISKLATSS